MTSQDPIRLVDDPTSSPELKRDLRQATAYDPAAGFPIEAGRQRLEAALETTGAAGGLASLGAGKGLLLVLAAAGAGIVAFGVGGRATERMPEPEPLAASPPVTLRPMPLPTTSTTAIPTAAATPAPARADRRARPVQASRPVDVSGPVAPSELELLTTAKGLGERDPVGALAALDRTRTLYPDGVLAPEREYLAVRALIALRRMPEARTRAAKLEVLDPNGPYAEKVRQLTDDVKAAPAGGHEGP